VLRDEDISFPPTTDQFSNEGHPILKDLTLKGILEALETQANDQEDFEPYLTWMHSLLQMTVCTLEPSYLDSLYEERDAAGAG